MKVGIVGCGFVGTAVKNAFEKINADLYIRDPDKGYQATKEELMYCDGIFVCVPSPSLPNGQCDTSILEEVVREYGSFKGVLISKVTAPPNVYRSLQVEYPNLVYAPEFLTAANADQDYINSTFLVVGGLLDQSEKAAKLIKPSLPLVDDYNVHYCTIEEASMMKYTINSFLATKLVFMNEIFLLTHKQGIDYSVIKNLISLDPRIGTSHLMVPGPDGVMGYGGACFPKDTKALAYYAKESKSRLKTLEAAIKTNATLRDDFTL